jgi:2-polyprenyl-3-methyl-5-hydroxy-6-metoxy-1,4-benzoquinol methylase
MTDRTKDAAWYDEYYARHMTDIAPWNEFLIPELERVLKPNQRVIELGCGQGHVLRYIAAANLLPQENICGIDQSAVAVDFVRKHIPNGQLYAGDLHDLNLKPASFDYCLLMETIEHLDHPQVVLQAIHNLLTPNGIFYLSFPNFLHLPWLVVRILAEKFNKPNWINLQPVDKIYTIYHVKRLLRQAGFEFERAIGTSYCIPLPWWLLRKLEPQGVTRALNSLGLWRISFHPIMRFRKVPAPSS